jgi:mannose-6-phosphate isomerase-like protein (cupin superfamily)
VRKTLPLIVFATAVILQLSAVGAAQDPTDPNIDWPEAATFWSAADLEGLAEELAPLAEARGRHVAARPMLVTRTHAVLAVHRDASAGAEQHVGVTDYWIVIAGEGTLVLGGEIVDREEIGAGEYRGSSIEGGRKIPVKPGDQIDIPPNVPHHIQIDPGKSITYLIIKINIGMYPWGFMK